MKKIKFFISKPHHDKEQFGDKKTLAQKARVLCLRDLVRIQT
jgi:hypothetical protein